jgi:hypothetical protein
LIVFSLVGLETPMPLRFARELHRAPGQGGHL